MTFLTVITRHIPKRADMLKATIASLNAQTYHDFQHLVIVDLETRGIPWSHTMLAERDWSDVEGDYVMFLDDDDVITDEHVFARLRTCSSDHPDLMVVLADHGPLGILPPAINWKAKTLPERNTIGISEVIPTRTVFLEAVKHFQPFYNGDYDWVKACFELAKTVVWLPIVATRVTQIGARTGK